MNVLVLRTAAFLVGSAIAGCVYATQSASSAAISPSPSIAVYPGVHRTVGNPRGAALGPVKIGKGGPHTRRIDAIPLTASSGH